MDNLELSVYHLELRVYPLGLIYPRLRNPVTQKSFWSQENEKAIEDAVKEFNQRMNFLSEMFPVPMETFNDQASDAQASATFVFLSGAVNIDKHKEFLTKLEGLFTEIVVNFNNKNKQASEVKCKQVLIKIGSGKIL